MDDPTYGRYVGNTILFGTQVYDDYLVAHTVRVMEYDHIVLVRTGSFGLDHTGDDPIPSDMIDVIHEHFMHDVARSCAKRDGREHETTRYRGSQAELLGLTTIRDKNGTHWQYARRLERDVASLRIFD